MTGLRTSAWVTIRQIKFVWFNWNEILKRKVRLSRKRPWEEQQQAARRKSDSEEVCVFTGDAQSAVSAPPLAVCFTNQPEKQLEHHTMQHPEPTILLAPAALETHRPARQFTWQQITWSAQCPQNSFEVSLCTSAKSQLCKPVTWLRQCQTHSEHENDC